MILNVANYQQLDSFLKSHSSSNILLLDANNVQFLYQNQSKFDVLSIFSMYDLIIIPEWVHQEISHSEERLQFLTSLAQEVLMLSEVDDYLPMIGYSDGELMELFRSACQHGEGAKFTGILRQTPVEQWSENWIDEFYEDGFYTQTRNVQRNGEEVEIITKKNAGEVSLLTLAVLLVSHFGSKINGIGISTTDVGAFKVKKKVWEHAYRGMNIPISMPISFISSDVILLQAVRKELLTPDDIATHRLRVGGKYVSYVKRQPDQSSIHVEFENMPTEAFIELLREQEGIEILF